MGQMKRLAGMIEMADEMGLHGTANTLGLYADGLVGLPTRFIDELDVFLDLYAARDGDSDVGDHAGLTVQPEAERLFIHLDQLDAMLEEGIITTEEWSHFFRLDRATATGAMLRCAKRHPDGLFHLDRNMTPYTNGDLQTFNMLRHPDPLKTVTAWLVHWDNDLDDPASVYEPADGQETLYIKEEA